MGVVIYKEIEERFKEIFRSGGSTENIRAAKYYLTLGNAYLVLPTGTKCPPEKPRQSPFTIAPGQSAIVSTLEHIVMPSNLIGILGSRFDNAEHGMLFFGGMLVDPGYGLKPGERPSHSGGEPLTFTIGNVGNKTIELRPGEDRVASIAFLSLREPIPLEELRNRFLVTKPATTRREYMQTVKRRKRPPQPLGFVQELKELRSEVDKVKASVEQVILFGVIVLAATLCAAVTTAVIAISGDDASSSAIWGSVGITLGFGLAAVLLLVGFVFISFRAVAFAYGTMRKVRLATPDE